MSTSTPKRRRKRKFKFQVPTIVSWKGTTYRVGKLLGKGGYAECYKVVAIETEEVYAIKIIPIKSLTNTKSRFIENEVKIHRALNHINIVKLIDTFETTNDNGEKLVVVLLELCEGGSLLDLIKKKKRMSEGETRGYLRQIITGLAYIHNQGIIHRDIKLGNILIGDNNIIKICDFGMAKYMSDDWDTICGTPNYIPPEVLTKKHPHSPRSDVWSLGVMLYAMVVGRPPFETSDVNTTYRRIRDAIYSFPNCIPVTEPTKQLIEQMLVKDPEDRLSLDQIISHHFFSYSSVVRTGNKKNIVDRIYQKLCVPNYEKKEEDPPKPNIWVYQYSTNHKYGIFYRLTDGEFGTYFNDGSTMLTTYPDNVVYTSLVNVGRRKSKVIKTLSLNKTAEKDYKTDAVKKIKLLQWAIKDMPGRRKFGTYSVDDNMNPGRVYLLKWLKTKKAIFFRLSNDTIQVQFSDKTGVILTEEGNVVTYINKNNEMSTYWVKHAMELYSIESRLDYVRTMMKTLIDKRNSPTLQKDKPGRIKSPNQIRNRTKNDIVSS